MTKSSGLSTTPIKKLNAASTGVDADLIGLSQSGEEKKFTLSQLKTYIATSGTMEYKGGYNATTNVPDLDTTPVGVVKGDMFTVTAAGTAFFTVTLEVGDVLIAEIDSPAVETDWTVVQANLTAATIKTQYESNADTNEFSDAEQTKLAGIETLADVTDDANVRAALAAATATIDLNAQTITNVGNVDGRNLSVDGTKLDGVEALADVTDETNVAATASVTANTAKVTNVSTDLTTTQGATTVDVVSSDGTNATLPQAIAAGNAGVMSGADKTKIDGVEASADVTDDANVRAALAAATATLDMNNQTITNVGTVDGRDLPTDGTKLDGVEALADVTDETNVAATASVTANTAKISASGRTGQERVLNFHAKVGATGGWVADAADDIGLLATLPASQSGSTLVVPLTGMKVGDTITSFKVAAQIQSAGAIATLDADLRKHTVAAADPTDASVGAITQVSVTAQTAVAAEKTALAEVVAADESFYVLLAGTTAAATDIALVSITITVTEA